MLALIGLVLLIGIVKKNAIMMIDFALEAQRERGLTPEAAIREACLLRFRPIMMTTAAALLGALPLAFGTGSGAELRQPLGVSIVGGLLVSQVLTLFTTPVVYLTMSASETRFRMAERSVVSRPRPSEPKVARSRITQGLISRPVATALLGIALMLIGTLAYNRLPVAALPRTDSPTIQVSASLPGASPETMASSVATPLERHMGRIAGLTEMTSTSSRGSTGITLQFAPRSMSMSRGRNVQPRSMRRTQTSRATFHRAPTIAHDLGHADSHLSLTSDVMPTSEMFARPTSARAASRAHRGRGASLRGRRRTACDSHRSGPRCIGGARPCAGRHSQRDRRRHKAKAIGRIEHGDATKCARADDATGGCRQCCACRPKPSG